MMNDFVNNALYPAAGIFIATLALWATKSVIKAATKNPWKAVAWGLVIFYFSWGVFSLVYSTLEFVKISEQAVLHKRDVMNIFNFMISFQFIIFFITLGINYFVLRKIPKKDKDSSCPPPP